MWRRFLIFLRAIFALFFRSLRTDARSLRIHMMWFLLMIVIYVSLWIAREMSVMYGAPGLHFFQSVMFLDAAFITLLGISFFSNAISEEKEEDTLGLMTMAGISPLGLLLGKSTSRLFQVVLLLAIQYPFTLLAVTMGGLLPAQIVSAYVALVAYTILLANVGLFCSVACGTSRNASGLTTLWLVGYLASPIFAYGGVQYLTSERSWTKSDFWQAVVLNFLEWIASTPVYFELYSATETGRRFIWSVQIVSNAVGGLILFLLSWYLFRFVATDPETNTASRGMVARKTTAGLRWFSAGRSWSYPLIWKDFFFVAGGWAGLWIRTLLYVGLWGLCCAANSSSYADFGMEFRWRDVTQGFQVFAHPLLALDLAMSASRVFQEEIKGQTLSSLLMLPQSIPSVVYSKLAGCGLAATPGVLAILLSFVMPGGMEFTVDLFKGPWAWWWFMNLLLGIHLTALFSVFLRSGALVLGIGTMIGSMMLTGFVWTVFAMTSPGVRDWDSMYFVCTIILAVICFACHLMILWKMPALGEK